ncbi:MAG: alpha/beta hydrolase [Neisseriaceae bacterium]|nr:alpha/beta hydrolase [Neisseriaceae bacterium]
MSSWENLNIQGNAGQLSCLLLKPDASPQGIAVLLHPNPLHGGSNTNKVIQTAAKTLCQQDYLCILPNLRGVGESDGSHDKGIGETDDVMSIVHYAKKAYPDLSHHLLLGGFSFGGYVACRATVSVLPQKLLLIGAAVGRYTEPAPPIPDGVSTLFIQGAEDEVIPLSQVLEWCAPQDLPIVLIPKASHFFHGQLHNLAQAIERFLI